MNCDSLFAMCSHGSDGDADYKLIVASSADYTSNAHIFCGPDVTAWKDFEIPGQTLFLMHSFALIDVERNYAFHL